MLYNNKLLNILRIVQKKLEAANEKVPKEITRMTLLCQKEDFSSTEFKETADKCYKKLVELSSGGYLYFPNAIQRSHFLGLLQNH
ncbi:MAG TPA: hypothetical protein VI564_07960, partial [Candidatus Nanoarchaeia archaeon]|nr:hypothetical protein [Candidatus Nanoarchaeia archaeon]